MLPEMANLTATNAIMILFMSCSRPVWSCDDNSEACYPIDKTVALRAKNIACSASERATQLGKIKSNLRARISKANFGSDVQGLQHGECVARDVFARLEKNLLNKPILGVVVPLMLEGYSAALKKLHLQLNTLALPSISTFGRLPHCAAV